VPVAQDISKIRLYAQEPVFTALDESFLSALDITVLSSDAENHITNHSFVFAPFVDWNLLLPVFLMDKDPELFVGNAILDDYSPFAKSEEKEKAVDKCDKLGKIFLEGRSGLWVPEFELHALALDGLIVYWKKMGEAGDREPV